MTQSLSLPFEIFKLAGRPTCVQINVTDGAARFVREVELGRQGKLHRDMDARAVQRFVERVAVDLADKLRRRRVLYAEAEGQQFTFSVGEPAETIAATLIQINQHGLWYGAAWDGGQHSLEHSIRFAVGDTHHLDYLDDQGLSPAGQTALKAWAARDVAIWKLEAHLPHRAISQYVAGLPEIPEPAVQTEDMYLQPWITRLLPQHAGDAFV